MPELPLISVRLITYNQRWYIRDALESVLMQKGDFSIEVCVGDDGSSDGTTDIVKEYSRSYPIIRHFVRSRNDVERERYIAPHLYNWRTTMDACIGRYVACLDGDDYWVDPRKLEKQLRFLEANREYVVSYHNVIAQNVKTSKKSRADSERILGSVAPERIPVGHRTHISSMLVRNGVVELPDQFREISNGDTFFQFLLSTQGKAAFQRDIIPNIRRRNPDSVYSYSDREQKLENSVRLYSKLLELPLRTEEKRRLSKGLVKSRIKLAKNRRVRRKPIKVFSTLVTVMYEGLRYGLVGELSKHVIRRMIKNFGGNS